MLVFWNSTYESFMADWENTKHNCKNKDLKYLPLKTDNVKNVELSSD